MYQVSRIFLVALLLSGGVGCSGDRTRIDADGVYFGELTEASPRREDGSRYSTHTIAVEAGQELNLTLQSADFDAYLRVEDGNGELIGEDDDSAGGSNANLMLVAPEDAIYTIIANTFSSGEFGEYVLAVRRDTPDDLAGIFTGVLPEVDGKSFASNSYPRHEIVAAAGEILDIQLTSGSFDALVQIEDRNGNMIAEDDDGAGGTNARLTVPIRSDGEYSIVVRSFADDGSGPYTLTLRRESAAVDAGEDRFEHFSGELTAASDVLGDGTPYAMHTIEASAGEELEIGLASDAFDTYLQIWTDTSDVLAQDDDSGGNLNSRLTFVVPMDGRYFIVANSVGAAAIGAYDITLRRRSLDGLIASGEIEFLSGFLSALNDALADGTPTASHEIEARAGERLDISMASTAFDPYLLVFDTAGRKLSEDDDSGGGTNARLSVIAPTDGIYRIVANSYDQAGSGPYTITLRRD